MDSKQLFVLLSLFSLCLGIKEPFRWMSNACKIDTSNGVIDLTPLSNTDLQPRFKDLPEPTHQYTYSFNPCYSFYEGTCSNVSLCQILLADGTSETLGYPGQVAFKEDEPGHAGALIYNAVDQLGQNRISTIVLTCDPNVEGQMIFHQEDPILNYQFELITKYACQTIPTPASPTGGSVTVTMPPPRPHHGIFSIKTITIILFSILCSLVIIIILLMVSVISQLVRRNSSHQAEKSSFAYKQMS